MNEEKPLVLTSVFTIKDKYDRFLLEKVLLIVQNSMTMEFIKFWSHLQKYPDKNEEKYFKTITNVIRSLIKANHNRRIYNKLAQSSVKRLTKQSIEAKSTISLLYEEPDIMSEVDSFLANIKASLDSLAFSLNFIFGTKLDGWHKVKGKSGVKLVNSLKNLPKERAEKAKDLATFIEDNIGYITYLVALRDSPLHKGKTANVSYFKYNIDTGKLTKPEIYHNPTTKEDVSVFLNKTLEEISDFVQLFIALSLSGLIADTYLRKNKKGEFIWVTGIPAKFQ